MNKTILGLIIFCLTLFIPPTNSFAFFASGKITISVVGEDGLPIDGARVGIGFDDVRSKSKENSVVGYTDDRGLFSGTETTTSGYLAFNVTKAGYYKSTGDYQFVNRKVFGWEPWNPELKVILRKIENPAPMYARQATLEIPVVGKDVGFDLIEYDWVSPYGKGKYSDLIFNLSRNFKSWDNQDCSLNVKFYDKYDGIILYTSYSRFGSEFKSLRYAPDSEYSSVLKLYINAKNGVWKSNISNNYNYYFRTRSEQKNGKFLRAMYGKISGHLDFSPINSKTSIIVFNYYLNPDYSRNLEFDPKRNLFQNLLDSERITEP